MLYMQYKYSEYKILNNEITLYSIIAMYHITTYVVIYIAVICYIVTIISLYNTSQCCSKCTEYIVYAINNINNKLFTLHENSNTLLTWAKDVCHEL